MVPWKGFPHRRRETAGTERSGGGQLPGSGQPDHDGRVRPIAEPPGTQLPLPHLETDGRERSYPGWGQVRQPHRIDPVPHDKGGRAPDDPQAALSAAARRSAPGLQVRVARGDAEDHERGGLVAGLPGKCLGHGAMI